MSINTITGLPLLGSRLGESGASTPPQANTGRSSAAQPMVAYLATNVPKSATPVVSGLPAEARSRVGVTATEKPTLADATTMSRTLERPVLAPVITRPIVPVTPLFVAKTTTRLAQEAIKQLSGTDPNDVDRALNAIQSRNVPAARLVDYLERKVKIGEVLADLAARWTDETKGDFIEAFPMELDQLAVMDCVVSIAILNDPDLEDDIRNENTSETTQSDLLENRRIVWQYPPPGTPLDFSSPVLVAVEHEDVSRAADVIESILGDLVAYRGYKLPKVAVEKLKKLGR